MKNVLGLTSIFALSVAAVGSASAAKADYTVRVDNHLNPSGYVGAKSANTLEVCAYTSAISTPYVQATEGWRCQSRVVNSIHGGHRFDFVTGGLHDAYRVTKVRFTLNGSDLFIIDQWDVEESLTVVLHEEGVDNEYGYCLSTDSADFTDAHCWNGLNSSSLQWTFEPTTYYPN